VSSEDSITRWLEGIRHGDPLAAEELWKRCFPELVRFARGLKRDGQLLPGAPARPP
jgi:hypothetical protein